MKISRTLKPMWGLIVLLLIIQTGCASSSVGSAPVKPGAAQAQPAQPIPITGGQAGATMLPATSAPIPPQVQSMLQSVVQHYESVGRTQALQDFTNQVSPFYSNSLFVLCIASDHTVSAVGGYPLLVGISADKLSDSAGGYFGDLLWTVSSTMPEGSFPFLWKDPMSGEQTSKVLYYHTFPKDICGVVADQP